MQWLKINSALVLILFCATLKMSAQGGGNLDKDIAGSITFAPVVVSPSPANAAFNAALASWLESQAVTSSTKDVLRAFRAKLNGAVIPQTDVNDLFSVLSLLQSKNTGIEDQAKVLATFIALDEYSDPTMLQGFFLNLTQVAEGKAETISIGIDTATKYFDAAARFATR